MFYNDKDSKHIQYLHNSNNICKNKIRQPEVIIINEISAVIEMNILVCGLNSYLGKSSLIYLQDDHNLVHGIVRDANLLTKKIKGKVNAQLHNLDVIRYNPDKVTFTLPQCEVAFYFTQSSELYDPVGANYELLSLRNFIQFSQRNACNRIVYIGTIYDRKYLRAVEKLFKETEVNYTIVLKDIAIGQGTSFEEFMRKMLQRRFIYLYKPHKKIQVNPVKLPDLMDWLRKTDWSVQYINTNIEFSGNQTYELEELILLCEEKYGNNKRHTIVPIHNKPLVKWCNKYLSGIPYDQYAQYIVELCEREDLDNFKWKKVTSPIRWSALESI